MAQTKIYPSTQTQVQAVQATVDEINAKIITPTYQVKTVMPSNVQQTVQADTGYTALWSVTVEPIAAAMPENLEAFIMNTAQEPYSLSLNGTVPAYACYGKTYLKRVYGNLTSIASSAFQNCSALESIDAPNLTSIADRAFQNCSALESINFPLLTTFGNAMQQTVGGCVSLKSVDLRGMTIIGTNGGNSFLNCRALKYVDLRNLSSMGTNSDTFIGCVSLVLIDFTNSSTPVLLNNSNHFINTNDTWTLAVKNDDVKTAYQSATNWSTYASHIKTVAEVEAEVGMSYDDYYLQCFGHPRFD